MVTILNQSGRNDVTDTTAYAGHLWVRNADVEPLTGWALKPEGFCRGEVCVPLPPGRANEFVRAGAVNVAALWHLLGNPVLHDAAHETWILGEAAASRSRQLASLEAPDFTLPDLDGRQHSLSEHRGKKVFLSTWASWCGCREDLPLWQTLYSDLKNRAFIVIAVAMDSRDNAARPWIEKAAPTYPCLIDAEHRVAELYNMVNVPQAVWIDERGRIVRPTETSGVFESFRWMDRATWQTPPDVAKVASDARDTYVAAIRDWVDKGQASEHVFDLDDARAHVPVMSDDIALAHANFRLGLHLLKTGKADEGDAFLREAIRLHPDSWNIWRQRNQPEDLGLAAGPEFWKRVDALGSRKYYPAVDMKGMPE